MYPNCLNCPVYRQFHEGYYFRSPSPYGPPIGNSFGIPEEDYLESPEEGSYSPPAGSPFFLSPIEGPMSQPMTPPGGMTAPQNPPTQTSSGTTTLEPADS